MKKWSPAVLACCGSAPMNSEGELRRGSAAARKAFGILYKAFVLLLCMAVLSYTCLTPVVHAEAIALGLSLACTALIIVLLTSMGMKFQSNNAEELDDWMTGKIIQFPGNGGNNNGPDWLGVTSIAALLELVNGKARVSSEIVNKVSDFGEFLMEDEGIVAGGQPVGQMGASGIVDIGKFALWGNFSPPYTIYNVTSWSNISNISYFFTSDNCGVNTVYSDTSGSNSSIIPGLVLDTTIANGTLSVSTNYNNSQLFVKYSNTLPSIGTAWQPNINSTYPDSTTGNLRINVNTNYKYLVICGSGKHTANTEYYLKVSGNVGTDPGTVITPSATIVDLPELGPGQYYEVGGAAFADAADASEALTNVVDDVLSPAGYQAPAGDPGGIEVPDGSGWLYETITGTGESIVTGIGGLFVPRPGFWEEYVDSISDVFDDRMGILTYPLSVLADFTDRVADVEDGDHKLVWDNIRWRGATIIPAGEYDFDDLLEDESLSDLYDLYMIIVKAIILGLFISLCWRKLEEIENG